MQSRDTIPFLVVNHVNPLLSVDTDTSQKDRIASAFPLQFAKSISGIKTVFRLSKEKVLAVLAWKALFRSFFKVHFLGTVASSWEPWNLLNQSFQPCGALSWFGKIEINAPINIPSCLRSSIGGVVRVTVFNSSATWAATFHFRGYKCMLVIFMFP